MKKILLTAAASTILASSSAMAMEGDFYGTLYGGMNKLNDTTPKVKLKSESTAHIGFGIGYHMNDMFRGDLTFDHLFEPKFKGSDKSTIAPLTGQPYNANSKTNINALMLNAYADLFEAGMAKFYVGAGVGASRVKTKTSVTYTNVPAVNFSVSTKEKTNFAYAAHVGASAEFATGVSGFIQYSWKDYGESATATYQGNSLGKGKFRGHHGSVGVRVSF